MSVGAWMSGLVSTVCRLAHGPCGRSHELSVRPSALGERWCHYFEASSSNSRGPAAITNKTWLHYTLQIWYALNITSLHGCEIVQLVSHWSSKMKYPGSNLIEDLFSIQNLSPFLLLTNISALTWTRWVLSRDVKAINSSAHGPRAVNYKTRQLIFAWSVPLIIWFFF